MVEYDIQLTALERIETHSSETEDGRSRGNDYYLGVRNVGIYSHWHWL